MISLGGVRWARWLIDSTSNYLTPPTRSISPVVKHKQVQSLVVFAGFVILYFHEGMKPVSCNKQMIIVVKMKKKWEGQFFSKKI